MMWHVCKIETGHAEGWPPMKQTRLKPLPRARSQKLVVQELNGETLVYDLQKHKAYCLNRTASQLWRACDGRTNGRGNRSPDRD